MAEEAVKNLLDKMILRVCGTPRKLQCPGATGALAVKLRKKMQGRDSDLSHQGVLGEQEAAWGELEEKEGEDNLPQSFQNPNIYRAEKGREEPLQQTGVSRKAGEQQEKVVSLEAEGIPEGEAAHLPSTAGQPVRGRVLRDLPPEGVGEAGRVDPCGADFSLLWVGCRHAMGPW